MKYIIAGIITLLIIGSFMYVDETETSRNQREIQNFINSKGKTDVPSSWKNSVGQGI